MADRVLLGIGKRTECPADERFAVLFCRGLPQHSVHPNMDEVLADVGKHLKDVPGHERVELYHPSGEEWVHPTSKELQKVYDLVAAQHSGPVKYEGQVPLNFG